jgi:predicted MFS family arabinose efflux permease
MSVVMMAVAPQTPKLVARFGADRVASTGLVLVSVALAGVALFRRDTGYAQLVVTMCCLACGFALTMSPMTTQLMSSVPRDRAGMGSATNDTTRELGGALGRGSGWRLTPASAGLGPCWGLCVSTSTDCCSMR